MLYYYWRGFRRCYTIVQCQSLLYLAIYIFTFLFNISIASIFHLPVNHLSVLCFHFRLNYTVLLLLLYSSYVLLMPRTFIYHHYNFHLSGQLAPCCHWGESLFILYWLCIYFLLINSLLSLIITQTTSKKNHSNAISFCLAYMIFQNFY